MRLTLCFIMLWLFVSSGIAANQKLERDTTDITVRSYDTTVLSSLKSQKAFRYEVPARGAEPWYARLWRSFWEWINEHTGMSLLLQVMFYSALLLIFVLLIMSMLGIPVRYVFYKNPQKMNIPYEEQEINMHQVSFQQLVENALAEKDFKKAVRYTYLQVLKELNNHQIITWEKDKTNLQYMRDITDKQLKNLFKEISHTYEYVWYGNFDYNEEKYLYFKNNAEELLTKLNERRVA